MIETFGFFGQCTESKTKLSEFSKIAFCIINNAFVKRICMPPPRRRGGVAAECARLSGQCVGVPVLMTCSQIQINILQQSQRHRMLQNCSCEYCRNDANSVGEKCVDE